MSSSSSDSEFAAVWQDAIEAYKEDDYEFVDEILQCTSVEDVLRVVQCAMEEFRVFRGEDTHWAKVRAALKRVVGIVLLFNDAAAEGASSVCLQRYTHFR